MTIEEFLLARLDEAEDILMNKIPWNHSADLMRLLSAQRAVIKWHKNWPVLLETTPEIRTIENHTDEIVLQATQQIKWTTTDEYVKRFGKDAPTAPLLLQMAALYSEHPDYDETWGF